MGLVKTRRLASMQKQTTYAIHLRRVYGGQEATVVRQRAKAGMKPRKISVPGKRVRQQGLDWRQPGKQA